MEEIIIERLQRYSRPIKTKNLASRLGVDRSILTLYLNKLAKKGKLIYVTTSTRQQDKICGWQLPRDQ